MKRIALFLFFMLAGIAATAQSVNMRLGIKTGIRGMQTGGEWVPDGCGFYGDRLTLYLNGTLDSHFSYSMRHNLNKAVEIKDLFQATDWVFLKYKADNGWYFSGGKVWMEYGSYEYDADPINIYLYGNSNGTFNCFLPGAGFGKYLNGGKDIISLQATRSPYCTAENKGMYSYNLSWRGDHGWYKPLFSLNALQMSKKVFEYHAAFGNRFESGPLLVEFDLINKFLPDNYGLFENFATVLNIQYRFADKFQAIAKFASDNAVWIDRKVSQVGVACEYYPIPDVRAFVFCQEAMGDRDWFSGVMPGAMAFGAGIVWYINFINK